MKRSWPSCWEINLLILILIDKCLITVAILYVVSAYFQYFQQFTWTRVAQKPYNDLTKRIKKIK